MQRRRLTTTLASLGLLGLSGSSAGCSTAECPCEAQPPEPQPNPAMVTGPGSVEPSGRRAAPKPVLTSSTPTEPQFIAVPTQFCAANVQRRDQALLRTASFLEAWNELAPPVRNPAAFNIPATEGDARALLCASPQCVITTDRVAEVAADYMVGVGALLPSDGQLLVVPELAPAHTNNPCSTTSTIEVERSGRFIHVQVTNQDRRYNYAHGYHGYGHGHGYAGSCESYALSRRDLVIDAVSLELELVVEQPQPIAASTWVELSLESPGVVLRGCDATLELRWTQ